MRWRSYLNCAEILVLDLEKMSSILIFLFHFPFLAYNVTLDNELIAVAPSTVSIHHNIFFLVCVYLHPNFRKARVSRTAGIIAIGWIFFSLPTI